MEDWNGERLGNSEETTAPIQERFDDPIKVQELLAILWTEKWGFVVKRCAD